MPDTALYKQKACRHGMMLYNPRDTYVGRSLDLYGEFSEGEAEFFNAVLRPGDIALDVGANIGCHTVVMAKRVGDAGVIVAIEPQRLLYQLLSANIALNGLTRVWCMQTAVSQDRREIVVPEIDPKRQGNFGGIDLRRSNDGEICRTIRIDDLQLERCRLIKLDVEGMELEALLGASDTIRRLQPILYLENDRKENADELESLVNSYGYEWTWHTPPLFNPDNFCGNKEDVFENVASLNMVCIPKAADFEFKDFMTGAPINRLSWRPPKL